ncbi:MAG: hypothetical protein SFU98_13905 [Leptospiraceae bacterium]|nr:hypothetical protein [Leptospiraceae bacterium]
MKKITILLSILFFALTTTLIYAEAKAEPNRIKFAKGKSSKDLKGSLSVDLEQEYVFGAKKGQTIYITNSDSDKFAYRLFSEDGINKDSKDLAEPTMEFVVPKTGDYMLFVRRANKKPKSAKFSITLAIE